MTADEGSIVTVTGEIEPEEFGITLPHEHLFADWTAGKYEPPDSAAKRAIAEAPISLENIGWVRINHTSHKDNLKLDSIDTAIEEVNHYLAAGGDSLVDVTPKNVGGDPRAVRAVARRTGIQIVHGTAFYTRSSHPDRLDSMSITEIEEEFVDDIENGIGKTNVRAGLVGEIGVSEDVHSVEENVLRAGARAAIRTGAAVSIHPPFEGSPDNPPSKRCLELLDVVEEEGLRPERVVICHRDTSKWREPDLSYQRKLLNRGAYLEYDLFGHDSRYYGDKEEATLSDMDRVERLRDLVEYGYEDQLLISHDVFVKCQLQTYGGFGYSHILENVVPVFRDLGVTAIDRIVRENPKELLTFESPPA